MYVSKELALILKEKENSMCKDLDYSNTTNESLIDWIFDNLTACDINDALLDYDINQLKFWYKTLLDHNFGLMHEFIGRLEEWFESNRFDLFPNRSTYGEYYYTIYKYFGTVRRIKIDTSYFDTKQQAKHEAIMKCFELLKTDKHEE